MVKVGWGRLSAHESSRWPTLYYWPGKAFSAARGSARWAGCPKPNWERASHSLPHINTLLLYLLSPASLLLLASGAQRVCQQTLIFKVSGHLLCYSASCAHGEPVNLEGRVHVRAGWGGTRRLRLWLGSGALVAATTTSERREWDVGSQNTAQPRVATAGRCLSP
ncbi:hypothetical protein VTK56DRAFT_10050 [Thermocarpiscus australiensis]